MGLPIQFTSVPIELLRIMTVRTPNPFAAPLAGLVTSIFTEPLLIQRIILLLL